MRKNILITGGAGFIGSHVVRLFVNKYKEDQIFNLDAFLYEHRVAFVVMVGRTVAFDGNMCQLESHTNADKAAHCVHWFGAFRLWKASR